VPGFAMNSFILGYHPNDESIAGYLARRGFEVWCVDLRGQGVARPTGRRKAFGITDIGVVDLGAALDGIAARTESARRGFDLVGCSLGATYVFMRATWGEDDRIRRIINLGGPLRWTAVHGFVRTVAGLPLPWGALAMRGTRHLARTVLPVAARVPGFLHIYLHPAHCDLSDPATLTQVVDDPIPSVNATIARWIRAGDLVLDGRSLTADVSHLRQPLLTVVANADGIVPEATVCSAHNAMRDAPRRVVYAGNHRVPMAHADLFISNHAREQVFDPMLEWLKS
jgi:predicted alpha/beta hydrolase